MTSAVVAGGGISGLVAAYRIVQALPDAEVTVLESRGRLGGCIARTDLGGFASQGADAGAEASLFVRPETAALCHELGLELEHPDPAQASQIHSGGAMHAMPRDTLMGVPADPDVLAGILSPLDIERIRDERFSGKPADAQLRDVSVGGFLAERLGDALVDTVVDPLLGGVYAGRCRDLSLAATIPALLPAAQQGTSVRSAVAQALRARQTGKAVSGAHVPGSQTRSGAASARPVFMSLRGGMNRLIARLAQVLEELGVQILTDAPVESVTAGSDRRWTITSQETGRVVVRSADIAVLAVPAYAAAPLLDTVEPAAATRLRTVEYASSALVSAVIDTSEQPLSGSGFLVPITEERFLKASTFASNKWPWLAQTTRQGTAVVRMSTGRYGDPSHVWADLSDAELMEAAIRDWREITGHQGRVLHSEVTRWHRALPQYFPGHLDRSAETDALIAQLPGLGLVGSAYGGVGIPACIQRAEAEAARLLTPSAR